MKENCAVIACMTAAFCLSGVLCACAQEESFDLKVADLESRINIERDEMSDLRQRQARAQRQKSLLALEIEQELGRISKLNSEIKPASGRAKARASWKRAAPIPAARPAAAAPAACAPSEAAVQQQKPALSDPKSGTLDIDAESQAEIDRLVAMREKLIAERDSLEQIVKPATGAP